MRPVPVHPTTTIESTIPGEPWITFTFKGSTITVQETEAPEAHFTTAPETAQETSKSLRSTTSSQTSPSRAPSPGMPCSQDVKTILNVSDGRALATACPTFTGSIVVPTNVSSPIDFTGLEKLTGSLICDGGTLDGMSSLSASDLVEIGGSLTIHDDTSVQNASFPELAAIGGLSVVGNPALSIFESMPKLIFIQGPAILNGTFSRVSFPALTTVLGPFSLYSTKALKCADVAPKYDPKKSLGNGFFVCQGKNMTNEIESTASSGLSSKYKLIIGVSVAIVATLVVLGLFLFYKHRTLLKRQIALVKQSPRWSIISRRTPKTPASSFGQRTPRPNANPSFSVNRAYPAIRAREFSGASPAMDKGFHVIRKSGELQSPRQPYSPSVSPSVLPLHGEPPVWPPPGIWPQGPPPPPAGYVVERVSHHKKRRSALDPINEIPEKSPEAARPIPLVALTPPTPPEPPARKGPTPPPGPLGPSGDSVFDAQMELINELDDLNKKDKSEKLAPPERARREWIRGQMKELSRPYRGPVDNA